MVIVVFRPDVKSVRKEDEGLSRFVSSMRTLNKQNTLPPKRRELLEDVGFLWEANPNTLKLVDNEKWQKSIAAKVFF